MVAPRHPKDASLTPVVERARSGDRDALLEALEAVESRIAGIAFGVCWDPQLARDAVQETLLKCVLGIQRLRDPAAFISWVDRVATRASIDLAREASRTVPLPEEYPPGTAEAASRQPEGSELIESVVIRAAVARLPPHQRAVIVLFYWLDRSVSEIADALECEEGTVKSRLARARETLTEVLGEEHRERTH